MAHDSKDLSRREIARAALGAAMMAAAPARGAKRPLDPLSPGIKITLQIPNEFDDEDLTFAQTDRRRVRHDPDARRHLRSLRASSSSASRRPG